MPQKDERNRKAWRRSYDYARRYGISVREYLQLVAAQKNRCAICGEEPQGQLPLVVDHDHHTGKVRALLCVKCNRALGYFDDDRRRVQKALDYLRKHRARPRPAGGVDRADDEQLAVAQLDLFLQTSAAPKGGRT